MEIEQECNFYQPVSESLTPPQTDGRLPVETLNLCRQYGGRYLHINFASLSLLKLHALVHAFNHDWPKTGFALVRSR